MTATDRAWNDLPLRWAGRPAFTALHLGPGSVDALLALWALWRDDPARCARLHLVADAATLPAGGSALAAELAAGWPVSAPGWHAVVAGDPAVHWLLRLGSHPGDDWTQLVLQADAIAGRPQRGWTPTAARALSRLAAPGASLFVAGGGDWPADARATAALRSAGFVAELGGSGAGSTVDIAVFRHRPYAGARRPPTRGLAAAGDDRRVLIVGGGLAGCAVAEALAALGRTSTVFDRHAAPAAEASGNAVGLFHGIVTPDDGLHARYNRAAALEAQRRVARALAADGVAGRIDGLLRLQMPGTPDDATGLEPGRLLPGMRAMLIRLGLPPAYVEAIDAATASRRAGWQVEAPAWWYPGGGSVDPAALACAMLRGAGPRSEWRGDVAVHRLDRTGDVWTLLDADGARIDAAATVVLANAADAERLLGRPRWMADHLATRRGQLSGIPAGALPGLAPRVPVTGSGYVAPPLGGVLWFGATSHADDADGRVRPGDHAENLRRLGVLTGMDTTGVVPGSLLGRTAWRWSADDRLPCVGAVPASTVSTAKERRPDQPRHVPRRSGLYLHAALGSRGITWSVLGGRLIAAMLTGAPMPLPSDLVDAVDPARFVARAARGRRRSAAERVD